jgi:hypothetical protein
MPFLVESWFMATGLAVFPLHVLLLPGTSLCVQDLIKNTWISLESAFHIWSSLQDVACIPVVLRTVSKVQHPYLYH